MALRDALISLPHVLIRQRGEIAELFGVETRNKYALTTADGLEVGFAAEQQKGILGFLLRQMVGHWRRFEIHFFDANRQLVVRALHPFRFFFQRLEVLAEGGGALGAIQQRFAFFSKRFDVVDASERVLMTVSSPLWRPWTFTFDKAGRKVAQIEKRWSGLLTEAFTDKDAFKLEFSDAGLGADERLLLLAAAVFVDLQYFERKAE